jgi:hypothetical protein
LLIHLLATITPRRERPFCGPDRHLRTGPEMPAESLIRRRFVPIGILTRIR